jgi:hypothetical protein
MTKHTIELKEIGNMSRRELKQAIEKHNSTRENLKAGEILGLQFGISSLKSS